MFDYTLNEDQVAIARMVRELMEEEVGPRVLEIDEKGEYPEWVAELFRRYDVFATTIPEEYGGIDGSLLTQCVVIEQVARVCGSSSMIVGCQSLGSTPVVLAGSEEQKQKWLPAFATGEKIPCFALTEPNAGSDVRRLSTRAVPVDGGWRVNGRKCFITGASVADLMVIFAQVDVEGRDRITAFLMEKEREGFTVDKIEHKMGLRGSPTCSFVMEDVFLPSENVLGQIGDGLSILLRTLFKGRTSVAAQALGLAQGALDKSAAYATVREQFGGPLSRLQAVEHLVADMATQVEAARCLTYTSAAKYDRKAPDMNRFSAMAKLLASDTAMKVATDAVQIMGGYGYMVEYGVERIMRDAKVFQIFEGANEVQRSIIAQDLFAAL